MTLQSSLFTFKRFLQSESRSREELWFVLLVVINFPTRNSVRSYGASEEIRFSAYLRQLNSVIVVRGLYLVQLNSVSNNGAVSYFITRLHINLLYQFPLEM